jgi:curved DNA-binding protein CbpA
MEPLERKIAGGANPFELLGVPLTAGKQDIRRAWSELSRKMHPDALQAKGLSHLRQRVGSVFAALSEAHMQLSDKDKREQLKAQIERGEDPKANQEAASTARAAFESEVIAKEADKLLRAGKFDRALARYGEALAMNAGELDLQAAAIWCRYNLTDRSRETALAAEKQLATIVKTSPNLARAHYFRGMVLKDLGAYEPAMAAFGNAQLADPRLIDAERQARALRMGRTQNRDSGRFGLKGLFGKR